MNISQNNNQNLSLTVIKHSYDVMIGPTLNSFWDIFTVKPWFWQFMGEMCDFEVFVILSSSEIAMFWQYIFYIEF